MRACRAQQAGPGDEQAAGRQAGSQRMREGRGGHRLAAEGQQPLRVGTLSCFTPEICGQCAKSLGGRQGMAAALRRSTCLAQPVLLFHRQTAARP